jgi:intein-encoded DNA endonuclease-like protein
MSYNQIIREIHNRKGVRLSKSHVSDWVNGKRHPYGSTHELPPKPVPELAYVIGVAKGDGSVRAQRWGYRLRLRVVDKEFAQEFDRCASAITGSKRHSIQWLPKQGLCCVEVCSILVYRVLRLPFSKPKPIVSHCRRCAAAFLRGFFDSEASMSKRSLEVTNSSFQVLSFARDLLKHLNVSATGPRLDQRGGHFVIIK